MTSLTFDQWVQIAIALGTICAAAISVYNARIALKIASRPPRVDCTITCSTGFMVYDIDENEQDFYKILKSSPTFKAEVENNRHEPCLSVLLHNIGDVPIVIKSIEISLGRDIVLLNRIKPAFDTQIIQHVEVGMDSMEIIFPFYKLVYFEDVYSIMAQYIKSGLTPRICLKTNLNKEFFCDFPNELTEYIIRNNIRKHSGRIHICQR